MSNHHSPRIKREITIHEISRISNSKFPDQIVCHQRIPHLMTLHIEGISDPSQLRINFSFQAGKLLLLKEDGQVVSVPSSSSDDVSSFNPSEYLHSMRETSELILPFAFVCEKLNEKCTLCFEVANSVDRMSCERTLVCKRGLKCIPMKEEKRMVTICALRDLHITIGVQSLFGDESFDTFFTYQNDQANLMIDSKSVEFFVDLDHDDIRKHHIIEMLKKHNCRLKGSIEVEEDDYITRFAYSDKPVESIEIKALPSKDLTCGQISEFSFSVKLTAQSIVPVKVAFKFLLNDSVKVNGVADEQDRSPFSIDEKIPMNKRYLLDGEVSGVKTLLPLPEVNILSFGYIPLAPGFQKLPGLEILTMPSGESSVCPNGPQIFAAPVAHPFIDI